MVSPRVFSPLARLTILGLCLLWPRSGRRPRATPAPTPAPLPPPPPGVRGAPAPREPAPPPPVPPAPRPPTPRRGGRSRRAGAAPPAGPGPAAGRPRASGPWPSGPGAGAGPRLGRLVRGLASGAEGAPPPAGGGWPPPRRGRGAAAAPLRALAAPGLCPGPGTQWPRAAVAAGWRAGHAGASRADEARSRLERSPSWGWTARDPARTRRLVSAVRPPSPREGAARGAAGRAGGGARVRAAGGERRAQGVAAGVPASRRPWDAAGAAPGPRAAASPPWDAAARVARRPGGQASRRRRLGGGSLGGCGAPWSTGPRAWWPVVGRSRPPVGQG